ncbi:hypothetical protein [Thalassotalea sp. PS06]|uniref:hypothetical protein n=1 Tax=Thalassotalea sp. PS06 TaxID=2594005 RepID=UPI001C8F8B17|nr:hypothetical protein [Thalassotalea sp. PS06]
MENNVYAAPDSDVNVQSNSDVNKIYSPTQVAVGTFLGGPVGLMYFLMSNFGTLQKHDSKQKTLYAGIGLIVLLLLTMPFLPDDFPSLPFTVAYVIIARYVADNQQMKKQEIVESDNYVFQSNWKVLGMGLLSIVGSMLAILGPLLVLEFTGVISL